MGFNFRKSFSIGKLFRINISKSGIGFSFGIPGARITRTAKGKLKSTYSIPGTGISYTQNLDKKENKEKKITDKKQKSDNILYCENCGQKVSKQAKFCKNCGTKIN